MTQGIEARRLCEKIESRTGIQIADLRFYAAGQNANLYLVDLDDQRRLMGKVIRQDREAMEQVTLEGEGWMLDYLIRHTSLPVPKVYWYDSTTILMDFVVGTGLMDHQIEEDAAEKLASLHSIQTKFFGLERDTSVGSFTQPNHFELNWVNFFRDHRLLAMARSALNEGLIEPALMMKIETMAEKIDRYIDNTSKPSLIHGDLWGGNILLNSGKISCFVDPAIYYADPEMELAMIDLYGTFGEAFFNRYNEIRPLASGFYEVRRDIYALYPLLLQVRLNKPDQINQIETIVDRFIG